MFKTYREYRNAWATASDSLPSVPLNVDIELASVCNLECPFCFISDSKFDEMIKLPAMDGKSRRRLMPKKLALSIIDDAAKIGVPALKFNWRGESTLHPDYSEILKYAASKSRKSHYNAAGQFREAAFYELLVNTNANCKDESIDGLMAATKVMVSLDSCRPETYKIMRRGGDLQRATQVIYELILRGHPNIWIRRVMTKDNAGEDFYADVRSAFGNSVKVSEHHCFDRNEASAHEMPGCDHDDTDRVYCNYPSQRIVVSSSGMCYPCCIDLHETMPVGDINTQSITEIWNGRPMQKLRAELKANKFASKTCKNCVSWMAYNAPQRAMVQDVELGSR